LGSDNPHRHDGLDRLFNGQLGGEYFLFGEKEEESLRRDEGGRDKNRDPLLLFSIRQLIRHKAQHIISLLWKFNEDSLTEFSTPHIWIGGTPASFERDSGETPGSGFATRAEIIGFFGTDSVRIAWSILTTGIYFVDYSAANLQVTMIPRPAGKDGYYLESGLISPDGRWIAYNCYQNLEQIEAYA